MSAPFWETKRLEEMTDAEWESLCDGCARCCMIKLQEDLSEDGVSDASEGCTEPVYYTAAVCDLLDLQTGQCTRYPQRHELVPDCVVLDAQGAKSFSWLPKSCAYRTLAEGRPLPAWHPLVSGEAESVIAADISVLGKVVPVGTVHEEDLEDMIIHWVEQ